MGRSSKENGNTIVKILAKEIIPHYAIDSNQDTQFTSKVMQISCKYLLIEMH